MKWKISICCFWKSDVHRQLGAIALLHLPFVIYDFGGEFHND